jgi:hypothetical protein
MEGGKVIAFPFGATVGKLPNNPAMELLYLCLDGKPNATKKRIILLARQPDIAWIDDQTATVLIDALGLKGF